MVNPGIKAELDSTSPRRGAEVALATAGPESETSD